MNKVPTLAKERKQNKTIVAKRKATNVYTQFVRCEFRPKKQEYKQQQRRRRRRRQRQPFQRHVCLPKKRKAYTRTVNRI